MVSWLVLTVGFMVINLTWTQTGIITTYEDVVWPQQYVINMMEEQEKLEDYKRIIAESIDQVDSTLDSLPSEEKDILVEEVNTEKLKVKSLELEVVELKKLLHKVFQTTNDFQTNMRAIANESIYVIS